MLEAGSVLKERYLIEKHLGKGGMGSVYLATDQTFGSRVALKETIVHGGGLEEAFEREARVLNKLRHACVPVVMDYFIEGDGRFLVMQYIPGDDLSTLIERTHRPFPPDRVLEWADKLLDALTYLHTQEPPIIHRDIKPQNLKLTDRDEIVLLDFGLSKAAVGGGAEKSLSIFGYTPNYAPLEQVQGEGTDARSDLYSLAATLYHLLTGLKPLDVIRRLSAGQDPLRPIYEVAPGVSRQVSDVIMSALSIRREDRPASAAEMRMTLRGAAFDDLLSLAHEFGAGDGGAVGSSVSVPLPPTDDLRGVVPSDELPTIMGAPASPHELPTVMAPGGAQPPAPAAPGTGTLVMSPSDVRPAGYVPVAMPAVASADLPTVVAPQAYVLPPPETFETVPAPPPLVKNTALPSTVSFVYETVSLGADGAVAKREKRVARQYFEGAGGGATIAMVDVPKGAFTLGSPEDELERESSEGPAIDVSVGAFFVSRSPITQAQWRAVATSLPNVRIALDPDPSQFKGDDRPVETVSWEEATEFCERLARHTGRDYRLPSEAEWEYACRAGTSTPFCFGPTITVDVANVEAVIGYGEGPAGDGRSETTVVGSLGVANRFGLVDVHGNVWEWTQDQWHDSLAGAPADAAPRLEGGDPTVRVLRGGSWASIPSDARSAKRFSFLQKGRRNDVGFRIAMAPWGER